MNVWMRRGLSTGVVLLGLLGVGMGPISSCSGFIGHLSGDAVVEPVDTPAQGSVELVYTEVAAPSESVPDAGPGGGPLAGREPAQLDFKLRVSDTANVPDSGDDGQLLAARLHCAPEGANGPVAVTLFEATGGGVVTPTGVNGALTEGSIEENDCGVASIADLVDLLKSGDAYVQVATNAHPEGEIRGQIRELGAD